MDHVFDLAIIGGGINGCGCAADAALRGLSVFLCEKNDLASQTSSNSSKLIHGGLRYLEYHDFSMVKKALDEQQALLQLTPHLVHPIRFVLPYNKKGRPIWLLRIGLFLYDHLSRVNQLPNSKFIRRNPSSPYFTPLVDDLNKGFYFYDCTTDDARLTIANALQASLHGATITTQTALVQAEVIDHQWKLTLQPESASPYQIRAKTIINATGPWVSSVSQLLNTPIQHTMSLVKGSHLVVDKLYEGDHAYMLQHDDKRIIFVIPYHGYSMVGTTDIDYHGTLDNISIDSNEVDYLCSLINQYFIKQTQQSNIITTWSGIRPLISENGKDPAALSRDYAYHFTNQPAPAVTLYGGKITTYRQLSQRAIDQLRPIFPDLAPSCTNITPLPGAALDTMNLTDYFSYAREKYHWVDQSLLDHYLYTYGTRTELILLACKKMTDLGIRFAPTLYQREVDYLVHEEWATSSADILCRRTKLGLSMDKASQLALTDYLILYSSKICNKPSKAANTAASRIDDRSPEKW